MTVTAVIGAQFGDEAKGKVTDFLAAGARYVVRTGGGPNAGHSIHIGGSAIVLHQLSAGVLRAGVAGVSGPGMVLDPLALEREISELEGRQLLKGEVLLSDRAHVILPLHQREDAWEEQLRSSRSGGRNLGTTLRGIGPAYADRAGRWGLRMADLLRPSHLSQGLDLLYSKKTQVTELPPKEELVRMLREVGEKLSPRVSSVEPVLWDAVARGDKILLEGAQSALLDVDFGTYPYVTSYHPTSAGALLGSGIPPTELDEVIGVLKAYSTRVGEGPFPTEGTNDESEFLRREGSEYGATTSRPRRCGWLDAVLLRYACRLNGFTSLAVTKVDVLGGLGEVPVAVGYEREGTKEKVELPPTVSEDYRGLRPVYRKFPGWPEFGSRLKERVRRDGVHALPTPLRRFLEFLTEITGVPVEWVSFGEERADTVWLGRGAAAPAVHPWN